MMRLTRDDLTDARTCDLVRLARWLGVLPTPNPGESEGGWRHRLVSAIQREERRLEREGRR